MWPVHTNKQKKMSLGQYNKQKCKSMIVYMVYNSNISALNMQSTDHEKGYHTSIKENLRITFDCKI